MDPIIPHYDITMPAQKEKNAVALMAVLAHAPEDTVMKVGDLAERAGIASVTAQLLVTKLVRAGLLVSYRGPGGGVALARPAEQIRLGQIMLALWDRSRRETDGVWMAAAEAVWRLMWDYALSDVPEPITW